MPRERTSYLSVNISLYKPAADQQYPTSSTPPTRYRKHSYVPNDVENSLSLPDKLELLNSVRSRRSSTESMTPQMTPLDTPSGSLRINSFSPQAGTTLTRKGSLSSLLLNEKEQQHESTDGFVKEAMDNKTLSSTPMMVVPSAAVLALEREEVENTNTSPLEDSHPTATIAAKPRSSRLTKSLEERALILEKVTKILDENELIVQKNAPKRLSLDSYISVITTKDKPRPTSVSPDSTPLFGRTSLPPVEVPVNSFTRVAVSSYTTPLSSTPPSFAPPSATVEVDDLKTSQVTYPFCSR